MTRPTPESPGAAFEWQAWQLALVGCAAWVVVAALWRHHDRAQLRSFRADRCAPERGDGNAAGAATANATRELHRVRCAATGHLITARWSCRPAPGGGSSPRVALVLPGGMAATMALTDRIHEALVDAGFAVLSFDRPGCGLTALDTAGPSAEAAAARGSRSSNAAPWPLVEDCVADMHAVMAHAEAYEASARAASPDRPTTASTPSTSLRWVIVGPSMGSIVGQCYTARHPQHVVGFVNVDGLAHPFHTARASFMSMSRVYIVLGAAAWLGLLRVPLWLAFSFSSKLSSLSTPHYAPSWVARAEMTDPSFWWNVRSEMPLMMDLAADASAHWGPVAVERLPDDVAHTLSNLAPAVNGRYDAEAEEWVTIGRRAPAERGAEWEPAAAAAAVRLQLLQRLSDAGATAALATTWPNLAVRIMSARSYNYAGGESFYTPLLKHYAAGEHSLHALLARDGRRYVFPDIGHDALFMERAAIVRCADEIRQAVDPTAPAAR